MIATDTLRIHFKDEILSPITPIIIGIVESVFVDKGLARTEQRDYTPHLTITKIPRRLPELDKIDPSAYADLVDTEFGDQAIDGLELLAMSISSEDEYYHCHQRLSFSSQ